MAEYLPSMMHTRNMLRCAKCHGVNPSDGLEFCLAQDGLEQPKLEGDTTMFPLTRSLSLAAAGAVLALAAPSIPARADELAQNLGPVGPREPLLTWVGSKRVIAFYQPDSGNCAVHVVVWDPTDVNAESTAGFQATLNPRQMAHINTAENKSLYLQCGDNAERLAIVNTAEFVVAGAAN